MLGNCVDETITVWFVETDWGSTDVSQCTPTNILSCPDPNVPNLTICCRLSGVQSMYFKVPAWQSVSSSVRATINVP